MRKLKQLFSWASTTFVAPALTLSALGQAPMMPLPAHAVPGTGSLSLEAGLHITSEGYTEPRLDRARARFLEQFGRATGILHWPATGSPAPIPFVIRTGGPSNPVQQLGEDESYRLQVTPSGVELTAPNPLGVLHGLQTFLQLVTPTAQGFSIPSVTIDDAPRFPWRGLMIDTGRHFMPLPVLRQNLDLMEATKLNVFHWHLSEDQGFRIESKVYPRLQELGSDGEFYTQDQVRDLIGYARDRGIRVIPEFDMPGHSSSWFPGYPELASGKGPYSIERKWGIFDPVMDPTRDSTYTFLDHLLAEMTALFPDAYFHIGGDECNGKEWDANPRIQAFMQAHGLKNNAALQAYFTARVQKLVTRYNKITVGWDEVLQPDTPRDVVIQSWRGQESLAQAARQGNRGILSAGYYLDLNQPASEHYAVDPMEGATAGLTPAQQKLILGGEAAMWSEFMTPEIIGRRIWPRAAAVAERLWSPQNTKDIPSMYLRLAVISDRLPWYGLSPRPINPALLQRMVGSEAIAPLEVLARVVEPPKAYARGQLRSYTSFTPLNRLVDVVPAESEQARHFRELAKAIAAGTASAGDRREARDWLALWRDNDQALQPLLPRYALTAELVPMSHNLHQAAVIGLSALAALESRQPANAATVKQQLADLKALEAPEAVLVNRMVPGVETLVRATQP